MKHIRKEIKATPTHHKRKLKLMKRKLKLMKLQKQEKKLEQLQEKEL